MKIKFLIIVFIIIGFLTYLTYNILPFAKGVIDDIPKTEIKKDSLKIVKIEPKINIKSSEKKSQYPEWIRLFYKKEKQENSSIEIIKIEKFNDSILSVIYEQNSGVCTTKNINIFKNKERIDSLELEKNCDMDLSIPHYSWKSYKIENDNYYITEYIETANDTLIDINGFLKNGYTFDSIETKKDSIIKTYKINKNGKIIQFEQEDDCIFDQSTQTDEFLKNIPEFSNYKWNDKLKTATIILRNGDTLIVKKGGCDHYGFYGNLILENSNLNINQNEIINEKALWIVKKLFVKSDFEFFKKSLNEKNYEIEKNNEQIYITFKQEMWCNATLVIEKTKNGKISIEIGYYIC